LVIETGRARCRTLLAESAKAVAAREKARQQLQASEQASKILRMSVFQ
jgi:hypothetical protein